MSHHENDSHKDQVAAETVAEKEVDLDTRALELTKEVLDFDAQIADLQKKRAVVQKERRSVEGRIITRNMTLAAKKG